MLSLFDVANLVLECSLYCVHSIVKRTSGFKELLFISFMPKNETIVITFRHRQGTTSITNYANILMTLDNIFFTKRLKVD